MTFFDENIKIRMSNYERERINRVVRLATTTEGEYKYENMSHFIRCATITLLRTEETKTRMKAGK